MGMTGRGKAKTVLDWQGNGGEAGEANIRLTKHDDRRLHRPYGACARGRRGVGVMQADAAMECTLNSSSACLTRYISIDKTR